MTHVDRPASADAVRAAVIAKAQLHRLILASRNAGRSGRDLNTKPTVTVAISSFNQAAYLADCINSVIDREYGNIELIIVDDGSSDNSAAIIEAMASQCRARFSRFEFRVHEHRGQAYVINEAVEWARGTYFSRIAADDILFPAKTSVLVNELERETGRVAGVFAGGGMLDDQGRVIETRSPPVRSYGFDDIILRRHAIMTPCQMLVLEKVKRVGPVPRGLCIEDWYLWLSLTRRGDRLKVIAGNLVGYRQRQAMSENAATVFDSRRRILDHFADRPSYDIAMARCCLLAAVDHSRTSKILSLQSLRAGLRHSRSILLSGTFLRLLAKLAVPNVALRTLRRVRTDTRRRATTA